ncbi:type III-A CRISPR-associated RAMP protein Csm5 [Ligilactobacillus pabuli]|uniref:CRISPR system Cms protein Csm5 n=1 Tax=Ligilactobacillus pabuli TaxID=2886039 RepID=A0ABQ5JGG6_9LACO|nr:type III-A CRISPR-associated RAMP protein Csm5 [Ligilactobacillus pabuli]GKS80582.1 type III-A CRISPR-associated RAMP protein Csm5 [Ligilactobacillus pabuli]
MSTTRKIYNFILFTIGPVHIGSGQTYSQREYIYEDGYYYFPEMNRVYREIQNRGPKVVQTFEHFLMQNQRNNDPKQRLVNFLNDQQIRERGFGGYKIKESGFETEKRNRGKINEIGAFIKDSYGKPYIPGSSLKGAIRTLVLNQSEGDDASLTDIFSHIYVSDSLPIDPEKLILTRKWDYSGIKNEPKDLPVFREALQPFTAVKFTIQARNQEAIEVVDNLMTTANDEYKLYHDFFLSEFKDSYIQENISQFAPIYLGAGSGLWTKTKIKSVDLSKFRRGKYAMKRKGVFKLTKAARKEYMQNGKRKSLIKNSENFYEMGKAGFTCKAMEED